MPVDWGMSFDVEVAADACLAGESDFFAGVAEDFETEERVEPFPEAFEDAFGGSVFLTLRDDDAAGAALSEAHAIEEFVGTFVDLDTIFTGNGAEIFALCDIDGEFFVDEPDFGHGRAVFLRRQYSCGCSNQGAMLALECEHFQMRCESPDTEKGWGLVGFEVSRSGAVLIRGSRGVWTCNVRRIPRC